MQRRRNPDRRRVGMDRTLSDAGFAVAGRPVDKETFAHVQRFANLLQLLLTDHQLAEGRTYPIERWFFALDRLQGHAAYVFVQIHWCGSAIRTLRRIPAS